MIETEQWKESGDCSICRRRDYCKTQCKAHKDALMAALKAEIARRLMLFNARRGK